MPNTYCRTILSLMEFSDKLRLKYKLPLLNISQYYDRYTTKFSVLHLLACKVRDLAKTRNDESRDTLEYMAYASFQSSNACNEPIIYLYCAISELKDNTAGILIEI